MHWITHLEGGPRRVNHAAVCIGEKIFSFGGYCYSPEHYREWEPIPVYILDTISLRWSVVNYKKTGPVPFQRYGHTVVAYGNKAYMWGGRNDTTACDILCCFDTETLEWSTPTVHGMIPFTKDGHSACVIKNRMYIFGGFEFVTDQFSQEVHYLNLDTLEWKFVNTSGPAPSRRDFHTAVTVGDRMYIYGGRGDYINSSYTHLKEVYCPRMYYLDTVKEEWFVITPKGDSPSGRRSHSAWLYKDDIFIFGGYNGNTNTHFNDIYKYSIENSIWQLVNVKGDSPCERRRQACIVHNDRAYLFGGTSPWPQEFSGLMETRNGQEKLIDNSDLYVLDFSPNLKTMCLLSVIQNKLDKSGLPQDIMIDIRILTTPNRISRPINQSG